MLPPIGGADIFFFVSDDKGNRQKIELYVCILNILFSSNHNIHKSLHGLCFWASDPLIERFY